MNTRCINPFVFLTIFMVFIAGANPIRAEATNINKPVVTVIDQNVTCEEDGSIQIIFDANGPDGVVLSYGIATTPTHGTAEKLNENTAIYTPYPDYFGRDSFRFSAYSMEHHIGDTYGTISINVTPVPDKPIAQNIEVITMENSPVEIDLFTYAPDGGALKYDIKSQPQSGTLKLVEASENIYLYTPRTDSNGRDKFSFDANDGQNVSNIADVNIEIIPESKNFLKMPVNQVYAKRVLEPLKVEKPVDIVLGRGGNLFILSSPDSGQSEILVCDGNLQVQRSFDIDAKNPRGIAAGDNYLYVADTGGNRILRYILDGNIDKSFGINSSIGQTGDANGQFNKPWAVGICGDKSIYVSDSGNNRIQIFDSSGKFKGQWRQKYENYGKPVAGGFNAGYRDYEAYRKQFTAHPRHINGFGQIQLTDRVPLNNPAGFCFSNSENIFLADAGNDKIKHLNAQSGYLKCAAGQKGNGADGLNHPCDVAYDYETNKLFVVDTGNNRIQVLLMFDRGGPMTFVQQIDEQGLSGPMAVAVVTEQPRQFVYVADTGNNRVIKLQNGLFRPGTSPEDVWEKFKDALRKGEVEKALIYITPFKRDSYSQILNQMKPHLNDFVNGMGKLTPESIEAGSAQYEMSHTDPNGDVFSFPVQFNLDENGNWTITEF